MSTTEIDRLWMQAMRESVAAGELYVRHRFAALVAAAEREAVREEYPEMATAQQIAAAEREACARLCDDEWAAWANPDWQAACRDLASAIRARGAA